MYDRLPKKAPVVDRIPTTEEIAARKKRASQRGVDGVNRCGFLGMLIQNYRRRNYLTLEQLSEKCGFSKDDVADLEHGAFTVIQSLEFMPKLKESLGIPDNEYNQYLFMSSRKR